MPAGQVQAAADLLGLLPPELLDKCLALHERNGGVMAAAAMAAAMDGDELGSSSSSSSSSSSATAKALRATCRRLQDFVDASIQRLSLGSPLKLVADHLTGENNQQVQAPPPGSTQRQELQEQQERQAVQQALLGLLQRMPCVTQLVLRSQLQWVALAGVMAAGDQSLTQRLTDLHLQRCKDITSLQPLASLPMLRVLHLDDCD